MKSKRVRFSNLIKYVFSYCIVYIFNSFFTMSNNYNFIIVFEEMT
jgi:hypothetical protein